MSEIDQDIISFVEELSSLKQVDPEWVLDKARALIYERNLQLQIQSADSV